MAIILQVKHVKFEMQLWPWVNKQQGHWTVKRLYKPLVGLSSQKLDGDYLNSFWNNRFFFIFMTKICVTLNEGHSQYN